jgi:IS1 family transposase
MWRETNSTEMQSNKMRFFDAADAIQTFVQLQTTMNSPAAYDYSEAMTSETTGRTFGLDDYITLKSVLQEASRDMPYELWVLLIEHVVHGKSVRSMEADHPNVRKRMAVAKRTVETCLRKRDLLQARLSEVGAAGAGK